MSATANELGPVQMLVVGFTTDSLSGKVLEELKRLREADIVRLVDLLVVAKDDEGDLAVVQATDLTQDEAMEFGALVGALIGFGTGDEETMEAAAVAGATAGPTRICSTTPRPGTSPTRSRTGRRRRSRCSSTGGRSRSGMRSSARAASCSPTSGSMRKTWSRSAQSPLRLPDLDWC